MSNPQSWLPHCSSVWLALSNIFNFLEAATNKLPEPQVGSTMNDESFIGLLKLLIVFSASVSLVKNTPDSRRADISISLRTMLAVVVLSFENVLSVLFVQRWKICSSHMLYSAKSSIDYTVIKLLDLNGWLSL
jgi:hypothetical protein